MKASYVRFDYSLFDNISVVKQWIKENESKYNLVPLKPIDEIKVRVVAYKTKKNNFVPKFDNSS